MKELLDIKNNVLHHAYIINNYKEFDTFTYYEKDNIIYLDMYQGRTLYSEQIYIQDINSWAIEKLVEKLV